MENSTTASASTTSGYQFELGELIRVDSQFVHAEMVKPALSLLHEQGFRGAEEEFLKQRPPKQTFISAMAMMMTASLHIEPPFVRNFSEGGKSPFAQTLVNPKNSVGDVVKN